jgi:hypothetical protein
MCAPSRKSCAASCTALRFDRPRTEPLGDGARGVPAGALHDPDYPKYVVVREDSRYFQEYYAVGFLWEVDGR